MVLELGTQGTLMDHIILARVSNETTDYYMSSPMSRLKIAHQVAAAVADLHTIDNSTIPSIVHNDLCARQFLFMDGVYKHLDFGSTSITQVNKNGTACMERPEHMDDEWDKIKAPEEFHRHTHKDRIHKYKADVWVLGDILYYVLTKQWVFEGIPREEAKLRMLAGIHSEIALNHTSHSADKVVEKAIRMAWTEDADERPSASEIAAVLQGELERLVGKPDHHGRVWRVSIPPLPDDYHSNFDDFYDNLD